MANLSDLNSTFLLSLALNSETEILKVKLCMDPWYSVMRTALHLYDLPPKNPLNTRKASDEPKLKKFYSTADIPQNRTP